MCRVSYDRRIRQMHSLIVSVPRMVFPSCLPGHSFCFIAQECVHVLACMCARFSFIKKIPTGNSHTLSRQVNFNVYLFIVSKFECIFPFQY